MNNIVNQVPYLRTSRNFPSEINQLAVEVNRTYVDIANAVNNRIISLFVTSRPALTGEGWFVFRNQRQETFRQVYPFTGNAGVVAPIPHGINTDFIGGFTRIYGTFINDVGVWSTLPYVDVVDATNQISLTIDASNINITSGGGAPPVIISGWVVLEWLSKNTNVNLQ